MDKKTALEEEKQKKKDVGGNEKFGKDPATTNNEPFEEGQFETDNELPNNTEAEGEK